ncbi:MAG: hypothetical protein CME06_11250 [Gemmatimonadetes bacterium]|nr:hypothetical protein [Gemmatimonadota bacterium]
MNERRYLTRNSGDAVFVRVANITSEGYLNEGNMLWHNAGSNGAGAPVFRSISREKRTSDGGRGWGSKVFDFDDDGDLDIVSANGFITAGDDSYWRDLQGWRLIRKEVTDATNRPPIGGKSFSGKEATRLWRNDRHAGFTEIGIRAGLDDRRDGRGIVAFDAHNDGD